MFVVLTAVFSLVFRSDPTYKLNLLIGLFLWDFFAETTKTGLTSLHAKGFLLSKARFPSWIVVVTSISNPFITISVFAVIVLRFLRRPATRLLLSASRSSWVYVLVMGVLGVGVSLAASVLFLRYRDLNQIWEVVIQAGFFIAPIIYPLGGHSRTLSFLPLSLAADAGDRVLAVGAGRRPDPQPHRPPVDLALVAVAVLALGVVVYPALRAARGGVLCDARSRRRDARRLKTSRSRASAGTRFASTCSASSSRHASSGCGCSTT